MARDISTAADPTSSWLMRFAPLIDFGSSVLEIACGNGRNTRFLADLGCRVTAVDINLMPQTFPGVKFVKADIEKDPWPFEESAFDVVVGIHYLWRPIFPQLFSSLKQGGLFLYETFTEEQFLSAGRPKNPEHFLRVGELLELVPRYWRVLSFEDGLTDNGAFYQRIAARKCLLKNVLDAQDVRVCQPR